MARTRWLCKSACADICSRSLLHWWCPSHLQHWDRGRRQSSLLVSLSYSDDARVKLKMEVSRPTGRVTWLPWSLPSSPLRSSQRYALLHLLPGPFTYGPPKPVGPALADCLASSSPGGVPPPGQLSVPVGFFFPLVQLINVWWDSRSLRCEPGNTQGAANYLLSVRPISFLQCFGLEGALELTQVAGIDRVQRRFPPRHRQC